MAPLRSLNVVVVGANRGIGLELVSQYLELENVRVVASTRKPSAALSSLAEKYGDSLTIVTADVQKPETLKAAAAAVAAEFPDGIDILINNAGVVQQGTDGGMELSLEEFQRILNVNVVGALASTQAFYSLLKQGGRKTIINMSSAAGITAGAAAAAKDPEAPLGHFDRVLLAYKVSKSALNSVTAHLGNELKAEGFTVIAVHPGAVDTDMASQVVDGFTPGEKLPFDIITPQESVAGQRALYGRLTRADNGQFFSYDGSSLPW